MPRTPPSGAWKPGKSGNPRGPKKLPRHLREIQELDQELIERILKCYFWKTREELEEVLQDEKTSAAELMVVSVIKASIFYGDSKRFSCLLDRLIGKPTEHINHTGSIGSPLTYSNLSDSELVEYVRNSMRELKDLVDPDQEEKSNE